MALGDFRENNVSRSFCQCALCSAAASLVSWGGWGGKKESARGTSPRAFAILFDYGYPARAFADERGQCDNRSAEMI